MATDTQFVRGAERLSQRIATIRAKLSLPVMTEQIGDLLLKRTQARFDRQVDPDGMAWKPLAEYTLRRKQQEGYGSKNILVRTEALRKAIKLIRGRADGTIFTNTGAGVRIGIDPKAVSVVPTKKGSRTERVADYAIVHQKGSKNVPKRRFLGIGRLDVKAVDTFLRRRGDSIISES